MIVEGCVSIVDGALENLHGRGVNLNEEDKGDLIKKLMVITCSDNGGAQPVLNV